MSNYPRRSARLSQQYGQDQPLTTSTPTSPLSSSTSTSTLTTSHPSPVNEPPSLTTQAYDQLRLRTEIQFLSVPTHSTAPLPSPSSEEPRSFFTYSQSQPSFNMPQQGQQSSSGTQQPQQTTQHHNSFSQNQRPNVTGNPHGQSQLPPDFLAEAAKRAQMACLMRDLGDVTL